MRKKVGTPILGSPGLKLFEPVAVEFMLQELEFHIPHVQPGSYHIYERDSAGDEDLHLGSPGGPVSINKYVLLSEGVKPVFYIGCPFSSHPVFQKNGPEFRHGVAEGVDPVAEGKAECPFELAGGEFVDLEFETLIVGVGDGFHIVVCFCLYHKYNTSAANTTIKCWKNSRETINFSLFLT